MRAGSVLLVLAALTHVEAHGSPPPAEIPLLRLEAALPSDDDIRNHLETTEGRVALAERLVAARREAVREAEQRALEAFRKRVEVDPAFAAWVEARTQETAKDVAEIGPLLRDIVAGLASRGPLADDLRTFLRRPQSPRVVHERLVRRRLRPEPLDSVLGRILVRGDEGRLVVPSALRPAAAKALADAREAAKAMRETRDPGGDVAGEDLLRSARIYADRLHGDDPVTSGWRELLRSSAPLALAAEQRTPAAGLARRILLEASPIGRTLIRLDDGRWVIHPHFARETRAWLDDLLEADEETGVLHRLARREAACKSVDAVDAWMMRVSEKTERETESLTVKGRSAEVLLELDAEGTRTEIDLDRITWQSDRLHLLRSSSFYNPRTRYGAWLWHTQFEDHHCARLFGVFGWDARVSKNLDEFLARTRRRKAWIERLAKTHDKIVIVITGMPSWLSRSKDPKAFESSWTAAQGHPPKDPAVWKRMVNELATLLKDIEGVELYYEFWNEPDLHYWQAGLKDFLDLYELTARAIREADPDAKIGGPGVNGWDNKLRNERGPMDALVLELIRAAEKRGMPLDFVSWHHFGRPISNIARAREAIEAECRKQGRGVIPEQLVTEWTTAGRGTPHAAAALAETTVAFLEAGVTAHTISAWEEFHAKPDPKSFAPWGIVTQRGGTKNTFYVHRFLDRLARGSEGVAVVRAEERKRTVLLSWKHGGVIDLLVWDRGPEPRIRATWEALKEAGFTVEDARPYRTFDTLVRAITTGRPRDERHRDAFADAKKVHDEHPVKTPRVVLRFPGKRLEVLAAESAWMAHEPREVVVHDDLVTCPLRQGEVLRLTLRVR